MRTLQITFIMLIILNVIIYLIGAFITLNLCWVTSMSFFDLRVFETILFVLAFVILKSID